MAWTEQAILSWDVTLKQPHPSVEIDSVIAYCAATDLVVSLSETKGLLLLKDRRGMKPERTWTTPVEIVDHGGFSPDGRLLAIRGLARDVRLTPSGPEPISWIQTTILESESGRRVLTFNSGGNRLTFSDDGSLLASSGHPGLHLWRLGKAPRVTQALYSGNDIVFLKKGAEVIAGDYRTLRRFDVASGKLLSQDDRGYSVGAREFSPDGKLMIQYNGALRLASVNSGRIAWRFDDSSIDYQRAWFIPSGRMVAGLHSKGINLHDVATGKITKTFPLLPDSSGPAAASADASLVARALGEDIYTIRDAEPRVIKKIASVKSDVRQLVMSPDGRSLFCVCDMGLLWPALDTDEPPRAIRLEGQVWDAQYTRDGKHLLLAMPHSPYVSGVVMQVDVATCRVESRHEFSTTAPWKITLHPDGRTAVISTYRADDELGHTHNAWAFDLLGQRKSKFLGIPNVDAILPSGREAIVNSPDGLSQLVVPLPAQLLNEAISAEPIGRQPVP